MKKQRLLPLFAACLLGIGFVFPPSGKAQDLATTSSNSSFAPEYQFMINLLTGFDQSPADFNTRDGTVARITALPQTFETQYQALAPSENANESPTFSTTLSTFTTGTRAGGLRGGFRGRLASFDRSAFSTGSSLRTSTRMRSIYSKMKIRRRR